MQIGPELSLKKIDALEVGELVRFKFNGEPALAFVFYKTDQKTGFAMLESAEGEPFHQQIERVSSRFLSYGTGWAIEAVPGDDVMSGDKSSGDVSGTLFLADDGFQLLLGPHAEDVRHNELVVRLPSMEIESLNSNSVAMRGWRLWASNDDRDREGAKPLFEFGLGSKYGMLSPNKPK